MVFDHWISPTSSILATPSSTTNKPTTKQTWFGSRNNFIQVFQLTLVCLFVCLILLLGTERRGALHCWSCSTSQSSIHPPLILSGKQKRKTEKKKKKKLASLPAFSVFSSILGSFQCITCIIWDIILWDIMHLACSSFQACFGFMIYDSGLGFRIQDSGSQDTWGRKKRK
ncbi:hypothetical protein BD289DRAFT_16290 [Coniella lustricola]|uniref:Uncharacterized protein n=1 Tax=Coniella lustricola TaxID=2025994 RepID=A0A2T3A3X1_9PEZI|nr:hypothetical protein BD289DRAFT_16290 [Coniella lustricola]